MTKVKCDECDETGYIDHSGEGYISRASCKCGWAMAQPISKESWQAWYANKSTKDLAMLEAEQE